MNMQADPVEAGLQAIAARRGWALRPASVRDVRTLAEDIDPSDRTDLASTWRQDWMLELHASLLHSDHAYVATTDRMDGFVVFGVHHDRNLAKAGQAWLIRTETFSRALRETGTLADLLALRLVTTEVLQLFAQRYGAVFNFFPKSQPRTIKWLSLCGLAAMDRSDIAQDYLVVGAGRGFAALSGDGHVWKDYLGDLIP